MKIFVGSLILAACLAHAATADEDWSQVKPHPDATLTWSVSSAASGKWNRAEMYLSAPGATRPLLRVRCIDPMVLRFFYVSPDLTPQATYIARIRAHTSVLAMAGWTEPRRDGLVEAGFDPMKDETFFADMKGGGALAVIVNTRTDAAFVSFLTPPLGPETAQFFAACAA